MQWQDLMRQFAKIVGDALAIRWLAEQRAPGQQKAETGQNATKEENRASKSRQSPIEPNNSYRDE